MTMLRIETNASARTLRLIGELDMASAPQLNALLAHVADESSDLTLDLSELTFMDSTGLHAVVDLARALDACATLMLLSPSPTVARVLDIAGLVESIPNLRIVEAPASAH
jgi:anti-sigma B factor antagonist